MRPSIDKVAVLACALALASSVAGTLSCSFLNPELPPYQVERLVFYTGGYDGLDTNVGAAFTVRNVSKRAIASGTCAFELYVGEVGIPREKGNYFSVDVEMAMESGERLEVVLPLDTKFWFVPQGTVSIKKFTFKRIAYADGGEWRDDGKLFLYPYQNENIKL